MRTFEFIDDKSRKFWSIEVTGVYYQVKFGKIGSNGQTQRKTFATAAEAEAEMNKLIKEKLKKGYVETTPAPASAVTEDAGFWKSLTDNPDDRAGWCAYADWLVEHGDPRGEFMQTQLALEDEELSKTERAALEKKEKALLKKHEKDWVGDWPELYPAPTDTEGRGQINHTGGRKYEFKRGVLSTVHFGDLTVAAARAFVKAPQTRFVRELFIGYYAWDEEFEEGPDIPEGMSSEDGYPAAHVLLRWPHLRHVRRFQYGWTADEVYGDFCNFQCHLNGDLVYDFVKQMPDVEQVLIFAHLDDATKIAALPMPNLRVLQLYHGWSIPLEKLAKNASLTKLTHLLCHPHALDAEDAYIRLPGLRAVCRSPHLTGLTHLRLRLADFGDDGIREIISSGILKRLKVLDLRHGCVTDEGAKLLAACPDVKNLEQLDLSRNRLTNEGEKALKTTKVPVELAHQRPLKGTEDESELNQYLYEADYE